MPLGDAVQKCGDMIAGYGFKASSSTSTVTFLAEKEYFLIREKSREALNAFGALW